MVSIKQRWLNWIERLATDPVFQNEQCSVIRLLAIRNEPVESADTV
jgi:hypothetical protein